MYMRGEYRFLSNMSHAPMTFDFYGVSFTMPSSENAFQAMKVYASDVPREEKLAWLTQVSAATYIESKALGRKLRIDIDRWNDMSVRAMDYVLQRKFYPGTELAAKLVATGDIEIVEDNDHGDRLWGRVNGEGQNLLGLALMRRREALRGHTGIKPVSEPETP